MPHPTEIDFRALLTGELPASEASRLSAHLDRCQTCQDLAESLTEVPRELWAALTVATDGRLTSSPPGQLSVPGYKGLRELGRGGCGVVYRAVEVVTGREVALKVLRSGFLGSLAEQDWFLAEARAAASLRHPNIVTILSVGETTGLPYYAMEYIASGSLADRLDGTPLSPTEAATLVEAIANAVQHAHETGIIHRDLKPGNILLDARPSGAKHLGIPKVSDFGMAKKPEEISAGTPTQAILGTPSYMAPEQAFGRSRDVGPAADVYAMGAILYELLIGTPPFRGGTPYETLLLVRSEEPVPPKRIRPALPQDLETICLKCLEKDPSRRYPSAAALAADLRAFRESRPVSARPVGWSGRVLRWSRRQPVVAGLSLLSAVVVIASFIAITILWRQAEFRGAMARDAMRDYTQAASKLFSYPGIITQAEREALVRAMILYERVLGDLARDPDQMQKAAFATLQLSTGLHSIGDNEAAARVAEPAVRILKRLAETHHHKPNYRYDYAEGCSQLGNLHAALGNNAESTELRTRAVQLAEELVAAQPENDRYLAGLAAFLPHLGSEYVRRGNRSAAEGCFRRSLEQNRELVSRYSHDPLRYQMLLSASRGYAELLLARNDAEGYRALIQERIDLCQQASKQPNWPLIAVHVLDEELVYAAANAGKKTESDQLLSMALEQAALKAARRPVDPHSAYLYGIWLRMDANRLWRTNRPAARERFRLALDNLELALAEGPDHDKALALASALLICPDSGLRNSARALEVIRNAPAGSNPDRHLVGIALFEQGQYATARDVLEATRPRENVSALVDSDLYVAWGCLVMTLWHTGERDLAMSEFKALDHAAHSNPRVNPSFFQAFEEVKQTVTSETRKDQSDRGANG